MLTREQIDDLQRRACTKPLYLERRGAAALLAEQAQLAIDYHEQLTRMQADSTAELLKHREERDSLAEALGKSLGQELCPDDEATYCCDGHDCGCLGLPTEPTVGYALHHIDGLIAARDREHDAALIERLAGLADSDAGEEPHLTVSEMRVLAHKAREGKL